MSVHRATARNRPKRPSLAVQIMKTGGFWLVLGLFSFLVGALLVSPVVNALWPVDAKPHAPAQQAAAQPSAPPAPPAAASVAPAASRVTAAPNAEPDVAVTPVRSRRTRSHSSRTSADTAPTDTSAADNASSGAASVDGSSTGDGIDAPAADTPVHRRTATRHRRSGSDASGDTAATTDAGAAPAPRTVGHRRSRASDAASSTADVPHRKKASKPAPDKPIQQGDTIE